MLPKVLLSDGDGVIWVGGKGVDGVGDALSRISKLGVRIILVTNNSSKTRSQYCDFLRRIGVTAISEDDIFSSSFGLSVYCKNCGYKKIFVSGSNALKSELRGQGIAVYDLYSEQNAIEVDAIAVSRSADFNFQNISRGVNIIRRVPNIPIIVTDPDPNILMKPGIMIPGTGSVGECFRCATNHPVKVLGKPTDDMFKIVLKHLNLTPEDVVMVGDRVLTDIAFASHHGAKSIFVLSGVGTMDEVNKAEPKDRPTYIFNSIVDVADFYEKIYNEQNKNNY